MRKLLALLSLLFIAANVLAQDSAIVVSSSALRGGTAYLTLMDGWVFKAGNNKDWARTDLDTKDWQKLKPKDLSVKYADKNGRVEGWFRAKLILDSTVKNQLTGFTDRTWGACDVYINGVEAARFGNTDSASFEDSRSYRKISVPYYFETGKEYLIALHFVDNKLMLRPNQLKSEISGLQNLLRLTGPEFEQEHLRHWATMTLYDGLLCSVTVVLSLLFWLIYWLNPSEKNIRRFAIGSTSLAVISLAEAFKFVEGASYFHINAMDLVSSMGIFLFFCYIPFILAGVFEKKVNKYVAAILIFVYFVGQIWMFDIPLTVIFIASAIPFSVSVYYLALSFKKASGAQWAIVAGFMIAFIALLIHLSLNFFAKNGVGTMIYVLTYTLSPPIGMMIYVAIRFKENINEVRRNAAEVVRLSEEKRERALQQQKILEEEVAKQTAELRTTLTDLRATQSQLIQSEKMASLGELTAGIAHEIQNPLNFVNNFSEVSAELIDEMNEELNKGDLEEAKAISSDIKQNLEKITYHGKRADAIVKGMLQHSRSGSDKKELTDINALCDEYVRLSYHGLRAKDKTFNAKFETSFDPAVEKINVLAQDIGRVILNIINNAFYATNEKAKQNIEGYQPTVSVSTKRLDNTVQISIADNGNGIPKQVIDKIFQPFFTTKPTGEGTGLGLSLSYDIVKKGHDGELYVETKQGEGTTFIIQLPLN